MTAIRLKIPQTMDYVGRVVSIVRRAKVAVKRMEIEAKDSSYYIVLDVEGPADEVQWLTAKLDKLPEVLEIGLATPTQVIAIATKA
jgi:acetolactate synthase II small subunit